MAVGIGIFAGTADGFRQLVAGRSITDLDYWHSSRQVPDTITEWPLFTLWLGDLHPHLLSIPLALAAVLLAWQAGRLGPRPVPVILTSALFGLTWAANPWAMPPTLVAVALMILCGDGRWHWPNRQGWSRWAALVVVAVGGWVAAAPFHLSFHPPFQGVKTVTTWTEPAMLLLWGGILLIPAGAAGWFLLNRILGGGDRSRVVAVALAAATLVLASQTGMPTLVMLAMLLTILVVAAVTGSEWRQRPAIALAALGVFLLLVPEVVYVVDSYGQKLHRMNTVFKCYIQAWIFLAVAFPALLNIGFRERRSRVFALGLLWLYWPCRICWAWPSSRSWAGRSASMVWRGSTRVTGPSSVTSGPAACDHPRRGDGRRLHRICADLVGVGGPGLPRVGQPRTGLARSRCDR